eukprot:TRINITY_DN70195_c0_g1_i1.p1 TRINITY_DN70195_c0_g1~~TRINITY_DN70195_c0_g1_i1.p1  ORF type:complete len:417 (+),score=84.33 TRINITY_DN70195_c0_g1_i1:87-1253(+)
MTNYGAWDAKAAALAKEAEEEEKREKAENDRACGTEEGPSGPPTAKARSEMKELDGHSAQRKSFIDWSKQREVDFTHKKQEEPIEIVCSEEEAKAVRLVGSEDVTYILPASNTNLAKVIIDKCKRVHVRLEAKIVTSSIDVYACDELHLDLTHPVGSIQADECVGHVVIRFAERDHFGEIYHQNCPGLELHWANETHKPGIARAAQFVTCLSPADSKEPLMTNAVVRGEKEFPLNYASVSSGRSTDLGKEPEAEVPPADEERRRMADEKRASGNEMFRASDFMQAAMRYTESLDLNPEVSAVWANRAQCWLKLGNHEKCLEDAIRCTEVDPTNAKGWFRKGMSLHAMERYAEAIPALLEAEKLEPGNKQIPEAIKMAQLKARRTAAQS